MATAIVDRFSGRAVVRGEDGRVFILQHNKNGGKPQDAGKIHLEKFLQPAMVEPLSNYDAGDYPYEALQLYLVKAYREESTLTLILISLDPTNRYKTRRLATTEALTNLADEETRNWVAARFKAKPLPAIADIHGVPDQRLKSFLETCAAG